MKPIVINEVREFFMGSGPDEVLDKIGALPCIRKRYVTIDDRLRRSQILEWARPKEVPTLVELLHQLEEFCEYPIAHPDTKAFQHVFVAEHVPKRKLPQIALVAGCLLKALKSIEEKNFADSEKATAFATELATLCRYATFCEKVDVKIDCSFGGTGVTVYYGSPVIGTWAISPERIDSESFGAIPSLEAFYEFFLTHVNVRMQEDQFDPGWDEFVKDLAEEIKKL